MRIVSLLPSATEILCALGLEKYIVGVSHECDYPPSLAALPRLTKSTLVIEPREGESRAAAIEREVNETSQEGRRLYEIDEAQLAALEPDILVTQLLCSVCAISGEYVEQVAARLPKPPVVVSTEPQSLDELYASIMHLAEVTETEVQAEHLISGMKYRLQNLQRAVSAVERRSTLVLEWTDPPYGAGHWTPSLIELAGGVPVAAFPGAYSQVIQWADAIAAKPEVIIVVPCGYDLSATQAAVADLERDVSAWRELTQGRRVVLIDGNQFANRPGPRLIDTAEIFAAAIHPACVAVPLATSMIVHQA